MTLLRRPFLTVNEERGRRTEKGQKWIMEGMEWRMLEKGEGEYLTVLHFH